MQLWIGAAQVLEHQNLLKFNLNAMLEGKAVEN
jgi:hypothetical protein